ncbi:MAG: hypothetical protein V1835_04370 [Candidatus Micrarchaeota archaeon]
MYVNIPVRQNTKLLLDQFREATGSRSYDETLQKLAHRSSFLLLADMEGILKGTQKFKREKLERDIG